MKNLKCIVETFQDSYSYNDFYIIEEMTSSDLAELLGNMLRLKFPKNKIENPEITNLSLFKDILTTPHSKEFMENLTNSPWAIDWDRGLTEEEVFMAESVGIENLQLSVIRARARNNYNGTKEEIINWFLDQVDCEEALPFINKIISEEWAKIENKSYSLF